MGYFFIALMLALTLYGQFVLKWQVSISGSLPLDAQGQLNYMWRMLYSPWVLSGFAAAFLASLCWILALTKLQLSQAYPFTALTLVLVMLISAVFFGEPMTAGKIAGSILIVAGVCVVSLSA